MIVELVGAMAVGKSTVAPLVARGLSVRHYRGQAFNGHDGERLTKRHLFVDRCLSSTGNPRLLLAVLRAMQGRRAKKSISMAFNICRRNRFAARAGKFGSGVIESGPLHAICQMAATSKLDVSPLISLLALVDPYTSPGG